MKRSYRTIVLAGAAAATLSLFPAIPGPLDGRVVAQSAQDGARPPAETPPDAKRRSAPGPQAPRSVLPKQRSDGARPLDVVPQTADEKRRQLSNLYAQLAAAEDEKAAAKLAAGIERLWRHSGSDTVNLLISRAAKVATEKRPELAEKLLDRAVTLAPDYTEGFSQRAFFHYSQSNLAAAVGDLRRVLALDPNHFKALEGLVQIWRDTDNKKAAYEVLKQLLDVHPFATGAQQAYDELKREVEGRGI